MRWFLWLLLVVALITGVLYGVGRFLLPNKLEVTRTASIERPRAAVFAMINDLRIAKEWSPYYARDPDADYAFNGDPGEGQSMRWISNVREVGRGRMSIVEFERERRSAVDPGNGRPRDAEFRESHCAPGESATSVEWTVTADCAEGAVNVPCRYMNLIMRGMVKASSTAA